MTRIPPIKTYSEEWQKSRSVYLGASDVPAICGVDVNGRTAQQVYKRQISDTYNDFVDRGINSRTWWGHQVEDSITAAVLHQVHPYTPGWAIRSDLSWIDVRNGLMASPDAVWINEDRPSDAIPDGFHELVEAKYVGSDYEKKWVDGPPLGVRMQCHAQMTVMGEQSSRVHIGAVLGGRPAVVWTLERDPNMCATIRRICRTWWDRHQGMDFDAWHEYVTDELANTGIVKQDATNSNDLTTVVSYEALPRIREWMQARKTCRQAEASKKSLDQWVCELLGDADTLVDPDGTVLAKRSWIARTSVDTKSLYADYPELEEKYSYPLTYSKLTAAKGVS